MDVIYYCSSENNDCVKKNICKRFLHSEDQDKTTLFKTVCTKDNDYILFIKEIENGFSDQT